MIYIPSIFCIIADIYRVWAGSGVALIVCGIAHISDAMVQIWCGVGRTSHRVRYARIICGVAPINWKYSRINCYTKVDKTEREYCAFVLFPSMEFTYIREMSPPVT
jgi:hypothetical protein